ncbi:hypothetical protein CXB51_021412 [Gossypium anomalum]|uniref:Uncharacterized protein n=1 Tax=Gossypium anomalum TaxID=47600 RepID=A0A8J5YGL5_9ROSI|nr:hypothetical protein CXB51_021412 [Gossypium anomalum]
MTMKMTIAYVYCCHCLHYSKAAIEANFLHYPDHRSPDSSGQRPTSISSSTLSIHLDTIDTILFLYYA